MANDNSIHPRVQGGRRRFEKVNTCGNSTQAQRLQKQRAGIETHLEMNPRDDLSKRRVSTINALLAGK